MYSLLRVPAHRWIRKAWRTLHDRSGYSSHDPKASSWTCIAVVGSIDADRLEFLRVILFSVGLRV
jgi:hypothetical protein